MAGVFSNPLLLKSANANVSTQILWLDASDASTITSSGGLVSQWNSKVSGASNATASGSARPTIGSYTINGLNTITFNGSTTFMSAAIAGITTTNVDYTLFVVERFPSSVLQVDFFVGATTTAQGFGTGYNAGFNSFIWSGTSVVSGAAYTSSPIIKTARKSSSKFEISINNGAFTNAGTPTSITINSKTYWVGSGNGGGFPSSCNIGEVILYNGALSDADVATIKTSLNAKWAIY